MTEALAPAAATRWGRRVARAYLVVGAVALAWMSVETLLGAPGGGTILAAFLTVPGSLLVARLAPPIPAAWPAGAQLALKLGVLGLLLLVNAAILYGMAGRFERDLSQARRAGG